MADEFSVSGAFLTEEKVERRLAAVLAADVAGYSRLMGLDEEGTLARLKAVRKTLVDPAIASHRGRIVKTTGDGMLVEFASAVDAVRGAVEVQRGMAARNGSVPQDQMIEFRIGIHVGDIIFDDSDIFGDGVNIAARLEGIAEPGGVCISDDGYRQIRGKVEFACDDLGPHALKNIAEPMRAWRIQLDGESAAKTQTGSHAGQTQAPALPDKPSIAVLPFQNMSADPEQEYFADGLVEDIITALSRFKSLFVIARNSSFTYKGNAVDIKQVGRELGVRYVLEGSVRKAGNRLRITGQLIETATGAHLWAEKIDGALEDVFELQDQITTSVVGVIAPKIEQAEIERANQKPTDSLDSYDHYLRAVALYNKRMFAAARPLFEKAFELDPQCAAAYAGAAVTISQQQGTDGKTLSAEMRAEAVSLANIGAGLANEDAVTLSRCGHVLVYIGREYDRGRSMVEQAVALNPNLAGAWNSLGWVSVICGEPARAIESFEKMIRLSPLDPLKVWASSGISWALWFQGRYEEGRAQAMKVMQVFRQVQSLGAYIANSVGAGQTAEARSAAQELLKLDPGFCIRHALDVFPIQQADLREKLASTFRSAGLPE
jgi:TolB-like protein/class 3 adenylate cyclase/Tfp pilus assembly protein PilF